MMRSTIARGLLTIALLGVPDLAMAQSDAGTAAERLVDARTRIDHGDLAGAESTLVELSSSPDARLSAQAWFFRADIAEHRFDFRQAVDAYRTSVARDQGGRYAARALARIEYLQAHSEGDFAPLAALERVRTDSARSSDPASLAELGRLVAAFPPGPVRGETRLLLGQAYLGRLHRPAEAAPVLRALAQDPSASPDLRRIAIDLLTQLREQRGELTTALRELHELGGPATTIARVRQEQRRAVVFRVSWLVLAVVLAAGAVSVARAVRAKRTRPLLAAWSRPLPIAHLAMLSLGGALLAHSYEDHDMRPFFGFGVGALAVYLAAAAWSLMGSERVVLRVVRATACAAAMLAVSFLAMHRFDPAMLEGIGL